VPAGLHAVTAGLEADQLHAGVVEEAGEQPDRVRAAADAGHRRVRQAPGDQVLEEDGARVFLEETAAETLEDKVLDAQVDDNGGVQFTISVQPTG
jgi:Fe-S cluster assembly iron-binding protein IscA